MNEEEKKKYKRDVTNMKDYYKNWDKFNVVCLIITLIFNRMQHLKKKKKRIRLNLNNQKQKSR